MKSIFTNEYCFFCETTRFLEKHHVFSGPYRKKSEAYGYTVYLCHNHHNEPPDGVHFHKENRNHLKRICQRHFEVSHSRQDFIDTFGRNYLEDENGL